MNGQLISKFLKLLRKQHGFTQEALAKELNVSRQAVSGWESGRFLPDLEALLGLSRLYRLTVNELLEPEAGTGLITEFEEIAGLDPQTVKEALSGVPEEDIVKAAMGSSPRVNDCLSRLYPGIDFPAEREKAGPVRVTEIERIQKELVALLNFQSDAFHSGLN